MRLSDVLSKAPDTSPAQVEGFLGTSRIRWGRHKKVRVGRVALNFFCKMCEDNRTFMSGDELSCLVTGDNSVSIDVTLQCSACGANVEAWFLVACDEDFYAQAPVVHVERYTENLRDSARRARSSTDQFSDLLDRAQLAYEAQLGAGSMIYLRKIFEAITYQVADAAGIPTSNPNGKPRQFRGLLEKVDAQYHIIPARFSNDGYKLFSELSEVIHGDSSEEEALRKYMPCRRLVLGVVENVNNDQTIAQAIDALGWNLNNLDPTADGEAAP